MANRLAGPSDDGTEPSSALTPVESDRHDVSPLARLAASFESLSRATALGAESAVSGDDDQVGGVVASVGTSIPGADGASVTVLRRERFATVASSDDWVRGADELQYQLRSGPCVDAIVHDALFRPDDIRHDPRWPEFGRRVASDFGVHSMLSFRLFVEVDGVAAGLNVYSRTEKAFSDEDVSVGLVLATLASFAVTAGLAVQERRNLEVALETNREIATAIGILMAQHHVTREQAFALLRMASQDANRKLRDVAADVVETGDLELRRGRLQAGASR